MKSLKYNIFIIIFLISGLIFTSCDDFLDVKPENTQTTGDYWKSKEEVEAVVGAGYYKLRAAQEMIFLWGEARGNGIGFYAEGSDQQKDAVKLKSMETMPDNKMTSWAKLYEVIGMANSVLKYGPEVVGVDKSFDENTMKSFAAEAYFQRSLAYFYLVRLWKDVPFVQDPYVDDSESYAIPQTDGEEILKQCLVDLNSVLENAKERFPESTVDSQVNSKGRATRWALYTLIADINLWLGNYDECISACQEVMNSGYIGLINGADWFTNFYPGNSNESIFEMQAGNGSNKTDWYTGAHYGGTSFSSFYLYSIGDIRGYGATFASTSDAGIWKYIGLGPTTVTTSGRSGDQNFIIYRLAEVYLMLAEAHAMKGSQEDIELAMGYVNSIRNRAGISNVIAGDQLTALQHILLERSREFLAEGKNWFDLLRIGRRDGEVAGAKDLATFYILEGITNVVTYDSMKAKLLDFNSWYLPINTDELNNNEYLVQNPFYEALGS